VTEPALEGLDDDARMTRGQRLHLDDAGLEKLGNRSLHWIHLQDYFE
jgi:hypothetical protein